MDAVCLFEGRLVTHLLVVTGGGPGGRSVSFGPAPLPHPRPFARAFALPAAAALASALAATPLAFALGGMLARPLRSP